MSKGDFKNMEKNLIWQPEKARDCYKTRIFTVQEVQSTAPNGNMRSVVAINAPDWVIIVPVLRVNGVDEFILVKQWRHGSQALSVEFPGGVSDGGEKPCDTARRELHEETGYEVSDLEELAVLLPNPAFMQNKCHIFFARCTETPHQQNLDPDEYVSVFLEPVATVIEKMGTGLYTHGLMNAALLHYIKKYAVLNFNNSKSI